MEVREARTGDEGAIASVHVRTWQVAYRVQVPAHYLDGLSIDDRVEGWRKILAASQPPATATLVVEDDGAVRGFAHVCPSRDDDAGPAIGEGTAVYLLPDCWDRGIGRAPMDAALSSLRTAGFTAATLWVLHTNVRARRFYESGGWRADDITKLDDRGTFALRELRYRITIQ